MELETMVSGQQIG